MASLSESSAVTIDMPSILALPEELFGLIIDQLVHSYTSYTEPPAALRNIRLVCKRWAFSNYVQSALFRRIELIADPVETQRLEQCDIARISAFAEHITFIPPLYSWTMTEKIFDKFRAWALKEATPNAGRITWEAYRRAAELTRLRIGDGTIGRRWGRVLRSAGRVRSVQLAVVDYGFVGVEARKDWPHAVVWPEEHHHIHVGDGATVAGQVGDFFFRLVMEACGRSGLTVEKLGIGHVESEQVVWSNHLSFEQFDFSHIKELYLTWNKLSEAYYVNQESEWPRMANFMDILCQCQQTLESMAYINRGTLRWLPYLPEEDRIFPNLGIIELGNVFVTATSLADWINACPKLNQLSLTHIVISEEDQWGWKYIFDALRTHPNRIELSFASATYEGADGLTTSMNFDISTRNQDFAKYSSQDTFEIAANAGFEAFRQECQKTCPWVDDRMAEDIFHNAANEEVGFIQVYNSWKVEYMVALYVNCGCDWDEFLQATFQ